MWGPETRLFLLDDISSPSAPTERRVVEAIDLGDSVPADFALRVLDGTGHPIPAWRSLSGSRIMVPAGDGPLLVEVRTLARDTGGEPRPYRLRTIRGGSGLDLRDGEPVDEWEEGGSANGYTTENGGGGGEPVDEWEEGVTTLATRDGEPVDEWEEGHRAGRRPVLCPHLRDDADDSIACATPIVVGGIHRAEIASPSIERLGDRDAFTFELAQRVALVLESRSALDLRARLFDARGHLVAENDDGGPAGDFRLALELPAGAYTLRVESSGNEGPYRLLSAVGASGWSPWP